MPKGDFFMNMSSREYQDYVASLAPRSPVWKDLLNAFWTGGLICALGQLVQNGWQAAGLAQSEAGTATAVSLIFLSAALTALSLYGKIAKLAGAGTLVPITGFANSVVSPAVEFRAEGFITGTAVKMFTIAGPVIVYGTVASVVYGMIYWFFTQVI